MSSIDPVEATRVYREHVLATKGAALDEQGRSMLAEDLRSPCTEEVAVFQAFSRIIGESRHKYVVVDTAPTGHTLLLLDATGSYHRRDRPAAGQPAIHDSTDAIAGPRVDQGHHRHPGRDHPGSRGGRAERELERAQILPGPG